MNLIPNSPMRFWAKTTADDRPGVDVFHHTRSVGLVAKLVATSRPGMLEKFQLASGEAALSAALHDIGKASLGFQAKCKAWLEENGLERRAQNERWADLYESRHEKVSQFSVFRFLRSKGLAEDAAKSWAVVVGSHHGHLYDPSFPALPPRNPGMKDDEWERERQRIAHRLAEVFGEPSRLDIGFDSPALWWLAGLTTVSDWIGSDETHFAADRNPTSLEAQDWAGRAVEAVGFARPEVMSGLTFSALFRLAEPNDLQVQARDAIREPGLYVIEAPMGMGKTEAALWCAYQLMSDGKASGLYFALPTQVTSNRIHLRVSDFVDRMCTNASRVRLCHANSWLVDSVFQPRMAQTIRRDTNDARAARDWFASAKRALLAPFGVGTVDQALLGIVAARHFFVRRFGLAGKVVVIDEVHSYDLYTGTLIRRLCEELLPLGCTVILLSATLTAGRRATLLNQAAPCDDGQDPYPLISGRGASGQLTESRAAKPPQPRRVHVSFRPAASAREQAWQAAIDGACVLWICDTVGEAQRTYRHFSTLHRENGPDIGLLHSRFPVYRRASLEDSWIDRLGKDHSERSGCVLVSTQVAEQSLDIDADLLVTELAPTDMLLQRIGRTWRHGRRSRPLARAECWILQPPDSLEAHKSFSVSEIKRRLRPISNVYAPYVLLRSWAVWLEACDHAVTLPGEVRRLLEATYRPIEDEPVAWQTLSGDIKGTEYAEKQLALRSANVWQVALNDEEGVQTRLQKIDTVSLVLAEAETGERVSLLNGETADLSGDEYRMAAARALHRNLARIPRWVFEKFESTELTKRYVRGNQALAFVGYDGILSINGLRAGIRLRYLDALGLEIDQSAGDDDESGI